jgi:gluconolactonase
VTRSRDGVLNREAKPVRFAAGFQRLEGPAFDRAGNLYVVEKPRGLVHRISPSGEVSEFCRMPVGPNGSTFHRDGRLFCTNPLCRTIVEIPAAGGTYRVFADRCSEDGQPFLGPNDLRFGRNGDLYWTDPEGTSRANPVGCVYWATPAGHVRRFASGLAYPNGLAFSADWSTLLVAESGTQRIHAYGVHEDGSAGEHWIYAQLEGIGSDDRPGEPDGIAFGADRNLYVAHHGRYEVVVVDPEGHTIATLPIPGKWVTNLAFRGTDLYVTESHTGTIVRLDVGVSGQTLFCGW